MTSAAGGTNPSARHPVVELVVWDSGCIGGFGLWLQWHRAAGLKDLSPSRFPELLAFALSP